jgi:hypothetical protein
MRGIDDSIIPRVIFGSIRRLGLPESQNIAGIKGPYSISSNGCGSRVL